MQRRKHHIVHIRCEHIARERGSEGREGARERGSEGARERGSEGARERGNEVATRDREDAKEGVERGKEEKRVSTPTQPFSHTCMLAKL